MRRIEQLIQDVKFQSNEQSNRFTPISFNKIFNDAQTEIARIINVKSSTNTLFVGTYMTNLVAKQSVYDLPSDVYADNSINSVLRKVTNGQSANNYFQPLRLVTFKEVGKTSGYIIQNNTIVLSLMPNTNTTDGLVVEYTKRIPTMSVRVGQISSINGQIIKMKNLSTDEDITLYDDYFSIVSRDGEIIDKDMIIDSYKEGKINTSSTITGQVGDYVTVGGYSTTNSFLPVECEKYLTIFAQRMIHYINSSRQDMDAATVFTAQEKSDIMELFADADNDVSYPPIVDSTYLN